MTNISNLLEIQIVNNFLIEIGGELCPKVISLCNGSVTDEEIFNNLNCDTKLTKIRSILNKLHYKGIATYTRTRDKNSGWYTYTWNLKTDRVVELITQIYNESIENFKTRLQNEQNYVYFQCPNNCERMPFEIASEYNFKCPECCSDMQATDNTQLIKDLEQTITDTQSQIKQIAMYKNMTPPINTTKPAITSTKETHLTTKTLSTALMIANETNLILKETLENKFKTLASTEEIQVKKSNN